MQLSPIGMDRPVMTTLSFPKILSAVTAISYFRAEKRPFLARIFWAVNGLVTVAQNSPGNHGPSDSEWSKIFYF